MGKAPNGTNVQLRVNRANSKAGPTRRDRLHDNPRVELRIRSDLNSMFTYRLLNVKRGDRTSDRGEKHPDCKGLSRANATRGRGGQAHQRHCPAMKGLAGEKRSKRTAFHDLT